jgi:outer membrane biosynthesis protein TonB
MKSIKLLSFFALVLALSLVACKGDSSTDSARESLNTTPAATTAVNPNAPATPAVPAGPLTKVSFAESTHDYGTIMEGEKAEYTYVFTNTGDEPLIISNAKGSCGCTVPDWPREPIAPGEKGEVKVVFDSKGKGKVGGNPQSKRVTITANTDPANTYLTIKGIVDKAEAPTS